MNEIVERVAREIAPLAWAALGMCDTLAQENRRKASLKHARKAIEAMREPTKEMLMADKDTSLITLNVVEDAQGSILVNSVIAEKDAQIERLLDERENAYARGWIEGLATAERDALERAASVADGCHDSFLSKQGQAASRVIAERIRALIQQPASVVRRRDFLDMLPDETEALIACMGKRKDNDHG